jgi:hypothetical protein
MTGLVIEIPATAIQGGPPGYFINISITTPVVFALKTIISRAL